MWPGFDFLKPKCGVLASVLAILLVFGACDRLTDQIRPGTVRDVIAQGGTSAVDKSGLVSPIETHYAPEQVGVSKRDLGASLPPNREIEFTHYSVDQGLSSSTIYAILQDSVGYLWFATPFGLNRYDGYHFKVFQNDPSDPYSLSNNVVYSLHEDQFGNLWVGTYGGGLNRYDRENDRFINYRHAPDDPGSLSHDVIYVLYGDRAGNIWVGTMGGGLNLFDLQNETFIHYNHELGDPSSLPDDVVVSIYEDSTGTLWVGTNNGLAKFDRQNGEFIRYQHNPDDPYSLSSNRVFSICEDRFGNLWFGTTDGGLNRFDRENERFFRYYHDPDEPHSLSTDDVFCLLVDRWGVLWVGTMGGGLNAYDPEKDRFFRYQHDPENPNSLSNDFINFLYEDREGILWVGTTGKLDKYDRGEEKFIHYSSDPKSRAGLEGNMVFSILEDRDGMMWIGTEEGLSRIDQESGEVTSYRNDPDNPNSVSEDWVVAIYEDHTGMLWLGTMGGGVDRFDRESGRFIHHVHDSIEPDGWNKNHINVIYEDGNGEVWIGTNGGLTRFDRQEESFNHYYVSKDPVELLSDNEVSAIYEDRQGSLWIAVWGGGLRQFDRDSEKFVRVEIDTEEGNQHRLRYINAMFEDKSGVMWFGTNGSGLVRYDIDAASMIMYDTGSGLSNDTVKAILEDRSGYLWLSTDNGMSRFDPDSEVFRNFYAEDGLQGNEFYTSACYRRTGEMWFGGVNGITIFRPEEVHDNHYIPPIVLISLKQNGEEVRLGTSSDQANEMRFSWPNNNLEFEFAALSFAQPEKNQYAFMLEGFDKDWNYVGSNRFGRYTNLPAGTYVLRLKGSNNDGVWNQTGTALRLTVIPPFWQTWWFRGLVALGVIASVITGYALRVKGIQARNLDLENQVEERTREIERRRQELEALFQADERIDSHLQLEEVLQELVDVAVDILAADKSLVLSWDDDHELLVVKVARGFSPETMAKLSFALDDGITGQVAAEGNSVVVEDAVSDPRREKERSEAVQAVLSEGIRSFMLIPIKVGGEVFGVFNVSFTQPHAFGEGDLRLFTSLVQRAADAIENARLFEGEQRRSEQFRVLTEVGSRITAILDIDDLLIEVTRLVQKTFGYYHVGIGLVEGDEVVYRVGSGVLWDAPNFQFKPARLKVGAEGLSGWAAATGEPLIVPDVSKDSRYVWMQGSKARSEMVVPIKIKTDVIGVLDVQSDHLNAFDETDLMVLQSLANQTAAAIQNARFYERAQQLAVMEERNRLARDLHDSAKQKAFAALAQLGAANGLLKHAPERVAAHLGEAESLVYDVLQELNILIQEMHPVVLRERGLVVALRDYIFEWSHQSEIAVDFKIEGAATLPLKVEQSLYRIAQEALANVSRHSQAQQVEIQLAYCDDCVRLTISDNGCGFDPETTPLGLGLRSMQERAEMASGELKIDSTLDSGTSIAAVIPV